MKQILMVDLSGVLGTGWEGNRRMMKNKLTDKKEV